MSERPVARSTDPQASHDAAESVSEFTLTQTRRRILALFAEHGAMTDEMLWTLWVIYYGPTVASVSGVRTRRRELCNRNLVRPTGESELLRSGRYGIVWEKVPDVLVEPDYRK